MKAPVNHAERRVETLMRIAETTGDEDDWSGAYWQADRITPLWTAGDPFMGCPHGHEFRLVVWYFESGGWFAADEEALFCTVCSAELEDLGYIRPHWRRGDELDADPRGAVCPY